MSLYFVLYRLGMKVPTMIKEAHVTIKNRQWKFTQGRQSVTYDSICVSQPRYESSDHNQRGEGSHGEWPVYCDRATNDGGGLIRQSDGEEQWRHGRVCVSMS